MLFENKHLCCYCYQDLQVIPIQGTVLYCDERFHRSCNEQVAANKRVTGGIALLFSWFSFLNHYYYLFLKERL